MSHHNGASGGKESFHDGKMNSRESKKSLDDLKNLKVREQDDDECTHFISIPFNDDSLKESFNAFRNDLIKNFETYHVNENIIQKTEKLHKTILNLRLPNKEDVERAKKVLENEGDSLKKIMNENTKKKHVLIRGLKEPNNFLATSFLFANVNSTTIHRIQEHLMGAFGRANIPVLVSARGFPPRANQIVVISKNLLIPENTEDIDYSFNPRPILGKYRYYKFGEFNILEMHLSRRWVFGDDGYYKNEMVINF